MAKIDFVPEDYIERKESRRANFFYLAMVILLAAGLAVAAAVIQIRKNIIAAEKQNVDKRMSTVQQKAMQLEQIQQKRKDMMQKALLSAELIEPAPRSVIVAFLVNLLPEGTSLNKIQLELKKTETAGFAQSKYQAAKAAAAAGEADRKYDTEITIEGAAASDIAVADYIKLLHRCDLFSDVSLVYSKQKDAKTISYRQFRLKATLRPNLVITDEHVEKIRDFKAIQNSAYNGRAGQL